MPPAPRSLVDADPATHSGFACALLASVLQYLAQQPGPVLDRAAVEVSALVVTRREEVVHGAERVAGIHVHQVVAGSEGAAHGEAMPPAQVGDVGQCHRSGLHGVVAERGDRQRHRAHRCDPTVEIGSVHAVVAELDAGQRAVLVNPVGGHRERWDVDVVPDPLLDERRDLRAVVDLGLLGAHHRPTAFGFRRPHLGVRRHVAIAHAAALGDLEEAVLGDDRADRDGFEEDVEAGVATHSGEASADSATFR